MAHLERKVVLVTRQTRLDELLVRHQSLAQARYAIERLGGDFGDYHREHEAYVGARQIILEVLGGYGRYLFIDRALVPNFVFAPDDLVLALGQDGVVANTLKYLDGQPLVGINPDPGRYDGVLLPFQPADLRRIFPELLADHRPIRSVTMAEARLSDGQRLRAVNDMFVGPKSHTSARYEISLGARSEVQSSSGLIVSTGLGSTAWIRSVVTGSIAVASALGTPVKAQYPWLAWDAPQLRFAVREPFPSRTTQASLVFGTVDAKSPLKLRSLMAGQGVIFSDGIESDFLEFNAGVEADIAISERVGHLVV
ncbi:MAG: sugar kinase [Burkholderiales bacterium]